MSILSCSRDVKPFVDVMREFSCSVAEEGEETGFSVGITQDSKAVLREAIPSRMNGVKAGSVPRPPSSEQPFLHFHSHLEHDDGAGLSAMDADLSHFREEVYEFYCVAVLYHEKIVCYRPGDVINYPGYEESLSEHRRLAHEHTDVLLERCAEHSGEIMDYIRGHDMVAALKLEKQKCPPAARLMKDAMNVWDKFISKTSCAEFKL